MKAQSVSEEEEADSGEEEEEEGGGSAETSDSEEEEDIERLAAPRGETQRTRSVVVLLVPSL